MRVTVEQLQAAAPGGNPFIIKAIADQSERVFEKYQINNRNRVLGFLSTALEESGFRELEENLHYSAARAAEVWPSKFPNASVAAPFVASPQTLANRVYGGRMGNTSPNDGWLYRGQGLIQITGRDNFSTLQQITGLSLLDHPELVTDPAHMLECSVAMFVEYKSILFYCDNKMWVAVWASVGTGRPDGKVINLANHLSALARLEEAIPAAEAEPGTETPAQPKPQPAPPVEPTPPITPPTPLPAAPVVPSPGPVEVHKPRNWLQGIWADMLAFFDPHART